MCKAQNTATFSCKNKIIAVFLNPLDIDYKFCDTQ